MARFDKKKKQVGIILCINVQYSKTGSVIYWMKSQYDPMDYRDPDWHDSIPENHFPASSTFNENSLPTSFQTFIPTYP